MIDTTTHFFESSLLLYKVLVCITNLLACQSLINLQAQLENQEYRKSFFLLYTCLADEKARFERVEDMSRARQPVPMSS
jgi:hypothetical protein